MGILNGLLKNKNNNNNKVNQEAENTIATTQHRTLYLLDDNKMSFTAKESFNQIRTNIMFSIAKDAKSILISSTSPAEGKTTIADNLAIAFAQTGMKILIVDADMRKPRTTRIFNLRKAIGLSDLIKGMCKVEDVIKHTRYQNLDILPAGTIPSNPTELLSSDSMRNVIKELEGLYDYVIVDSPPANALSDASIVASYVSATFLVVRYNVTTFRTIDTALESFNLTGANFAGFILNDVDLEARAYGTGGYRYGKYRYSNYYGSYYGGYGKYGYGRYGYGGYYDNSSNKSDSQSEIETANAFISQKKRKKH